MIVVFPSSGFLSFDIRPTANYVMSEQWKEMEWA